MNQSEIEAITYCNRRQARGNACDQVAIGFWVNFWLVENVVQGF